jgi:hypothetical protein
MTENLLSMFYVEIVFNKKVGSEYERNNDGSGEVQSGADPEHCIQGPTRRESN